MLLGIGQISGNCSDIAKFIGAVHRALGRIMYAANFYVALSDRDDGTVRFVYFADELDPAPDPRQKIRLASPGQSPTAWVILTVTVSSAAHGPRLCPALHKSIQSGDNAWLAAVSKGRILQ